MVLRSTYAGDPRCAERGNNRLYYLDLASRNGDQCGPGLFVIDFRLRAFGLETIFAYFTLFYILITIQSIPIFQPDICTYHSKPQLRIRTLQDSRAALKYF